MPSGKSVPVISLSDVHFRYGSEPLLTAVSLVVPETARFGIVGPNGAGKSTLLQILAGRLQTDRGAVVRDPGMIVDLLEQEHDPNEERTLLQVAAEPTAALAECCSRLRLIEAGDSEASREFERWYETYVQLDGPGREIAARQVLAGLGFAQERWQRPASELSGGERVRLALARTLVHQPDLMLLDEPTNHIDWQAMAWLENYLKNCSSAIIAVSHDRRFLDSFAEEIIEVQQQSVRRYRGNYSTYRDKVRIETEQAERERERQVSELARQEAIVQKLRSQRKHTLMHSRERSVEQLRGQLKNSQAPAARRSLQVRADAAASGTDLLTVRGLRCGYPSVTILSGLDLQLRRGERVAVIGPNGAGKTTLLKTIAGELPPLAGTLTFGHKVQPAYFDQNLSTLDPSLTPLETLLNRTDLNLPEALSWLHRFRFSREMLERETGGLSGGERTRLLLCCILASRPNLLLLDEPTNHLDLPSREAVEQALARFEGGILLVTHDRYLVETVATHTLVLANGRARLTHGAANWWSDTPPAGAARAPGAAAPRRPRAENPQRKQERLEREIARAEKGQRELEQRLADPALWQQSSTAAAAVQQEYEAVRLSLQKLYAEWEEAVS